jgi:hypothetical protein
MKASGEEMRFPLFGGLKVGREAQPEKARGHLSLAESEAFSAEFPTA